MSEVDEVLAHDEAPDEERELHHREHEHQQGPEVADTAVESAGTVQRAHHHDSRTHRRALDGGSLRLLHVHAHPDDESSKGAASTAKYIDQGVEVMVATCTGGERGSILNPAMERPEVEENITEVRRGEMDAAREILGITQVWLGFVDSGLPEGDPLPPLPEGCFGLQDPEVAAGALVKVIREFKPQVLTTYDEEGGYPHPDHIMCHKISMAAVRQAADPQAWPEHGEPWQISKVYYQFTMHKNRVIALDAAMREHGLESPYGDWLERWEDRPRMSPERVTTRVECADYFGVRDRALLAHATQVDPNGSWFAVPLQIQQASWPTEDFQLVENHVDAPIPEQDMFAGIADPA